MARRHRDTGDMDDPPSAQADHRVVRRADAASTAWRRARAVELTLAGYSYDDIAEQVGYANRGSAWRAVQSTLHAKALETADEYRELELARLDALPSAHWQAALSGENLKAAELCLRISAQRTKLLGLDLVVPEKDTADHHRRGYQRELHRGSQGNRRTVIVPSKGNQAGNAVVLPVGVAAMRPQPNAR